MRIVRAFDIHDASSSNCIWMQVKRLIASVDHTNSGTIDFNEFLELLLTKMVRPWPIHNSRQRHDL